jgi:Cu/Ag efflux protein CusF
MYKVLCLAFGLLISTTLAFSAQGAASVAEGTLKKIDADSRTVILETAEGAEQTYHFTGRTAVYGAREADSGSQKTLNGLEEGSKVAVHYTDRGTEKSAEEIDRIGESGLKAGKGTVKNIDRDAKTITLQTEDGAEDTYQLSEHAAKDVGTDTGEIGRKSEKATVYYTEEAGYKIARYFKKIL